MTHSRYSGGDARGTIIGVAPPDVEDEGQVHIGSPAIRYQNRTIYIPYSNFSYPQKIDRNMAILEAAANFVSADGKKLAIKTTYSVYLAEGKVEISSAITNTGQVTWSA